MRFRASVFAALIVLLMGWISGCTNKEADDLAKGQACLDGVSQDHPDEALDCLQYVEKYTSQRANIIKCGIYMTSGGLTENKEVAAANALKDDSITNKNAAYMTALSLDYPDVNTAYQTAVTGNTYCVDSGIPGNVYIASLVVAGTYMNKTIASLTGSPIDINDPSSMNTAVTQLINSCTSDPPDASCTTDLSTLGTVTATVGSTYCSQDKADSSVCSSINQAISSAGGSSEAIGQALFCYLGNKTYDSSTGACH